VRVKFWENPPSKVFTNLKARRAKLQSRFTVRAWAHSTRVTQVRPRQRNGVGWPAPPRRPTTPRPAAAPAAARLLRLSSQDLYIALHDLREYLRINKEGFRKIIKKVRCLPWPAEQPWLRPSPPAGEGSGRAA
jgi:hypothetical protein